MKEFLKNMKIETKRLTITEFDMSMAETVEFLMDVYKNGNSSLVYPVALKDGTYIGYVQAVPFDDYT